MAENLRESQAAKFAGKDLRELEPESHRDFDLGELIAKGFASDGSVSIPITPDVATGTDETDMPVAWRMAIPTRNVHGVAPVELGTIVNDYQDKDLGLLDNELDFDAVVERAGKNPAVQELYGLIGAHVVDAVKRDGTPYFSALERKFRQNPDGTAMTWTQLYLAPGVMKTSQLLEKGINLRHKTGITVPE